MVHRIILLRVAENLPFCLVAVDVVVVSSSFATKHNRPVCIINFFLCIWNGKCMYFSVDNIGISEYTLK